MAGSQTFDSGSGNFTVIAYGELTVECWGPGGPGTGVSSASVYVNGTQGSPSTVSTLGQSAGGGAAANGLSGGAGGAPSGGNHTNTTGSAGGAGLTWNSTSPGLKTSGVGGASPNGGGTTAGATAVSDQSNNGNNGNNGAAPGAGGSGAAWNSGGAFNWTGAAAGGGGGGAYTKSVYTFGVTAGFPNFGALLAYFVGPATTGGAGTQRTGGNGAVGRVKFTWTDPPAPTVSSASPDIGSTAGGQSVTVLGTNFTGATGVTFGGTAATSVVVNSSTNISCVTPAHSSGLVSVAVTTPGGTGSANAYTYALATGTLAVTDGIDTASMSGLTAVLATLGATDGIDTASLQGLTSAFGTLAATDDQDTILVTEFFAPDEDEFVLGGGMPLGAFGEDATSMILSAVEGADFVSISGTVEWSLVLSAVEASDTISIIGIAEHYGILAATEDSDLVAFDGAIEWSAILEAVEASDTVAITGNVGAFQEVEGILDATEEADSILITGEVIIIEEFEDVDGKAIIIDLSGGADDFDLSGKAINIALLGGMGQTLAGRALVQTLHGRGTTL